MARSFYYLFSESRIAMFLAFLFLSAGHVARAADTDDPADYTCSKTRACGIGCCGKL